MSFKERLAKHENILNRFKALYINKENPNENKSNVNDNSSKFIMNNSENLINNKKLDIDNTNNFNKYNFSYGKEVSKNTNNDFLNNSDVKKDKIFDIQKESEKKEENIDLGKIDNLLDKLNFKRENNIENRPIIQEKNNIMRNYEDNKEANENNINNNKKFDIASIKSKYLDNNINSLNITEKYYNNKDKEENNNYNITQPYLKNNMNDIKKLNQLNARSEIERIKSKYYSMNLNNIINKNNYLNTDLFPNNNRNNYNLQLNKDILEIKNKLELYRKEVKEISLLNEKDITKSSISKKEINDSEKNISINKNINDINDNIKLENDKKEMNIIENGSNQINIPNLNFKYNIENNKERKDENENSRKEIDIEINSYENYINNDKTEKNEIQNNNNNINGFISEIKINSNNQIINSNNNDFDYSEVLPIIDKVSKLKDINEIEDNYDKQKTNALNTQRMNLTNSNININSNEDEEVPNIVNSILDALSNKLITSNIENNQENENEKKIEKPKLISKNNNIEDKTKKIISFKEFLAKEENNKDENTNN